MVKPICRPLGQFADYKRSQAIVRGFLQTHDIVLHFMDQFGGPVANKVLSDIPTIWAERTLRDKGVLNLDIKLASARSLNSELIKACFDVPDHGTGYSICHDPQRAKETARKHLSRQARLGKVRALAGL